MDIYAIDNLASWTDGHIESCAPFARCDAIDSLLSFDQANASDAVAETFADRGRFDVPFLGSSDDKTRETPLMATELFPEAKPYSTFLGPSPLKLEPLAMEPWPLEGSPSSGLIRSCWREANARSCSDDEVFPGATGIILLEDDSAEDSLGDEKVTGYVAMKREILGARSLTSFGTAHSDSNSMHSIASMASLVAEINGNGSGSANYTVPTGSEPHPCDTSAMRSVGSLGSMSMWGGAVIPPGHVPMTDYNPRRHIKYPNSSCGSPTAVSGTIAVIDGIPSPTIPKKRVSVPSSKRAMSDAELMASFAPKGPKRPCARNQGVGKMAPNPHGLCCSACGTQTTPVWRAGPHGPKTLCNACGVRYMKVIGAKRK